MKRVFKSSIYILLSIFWITSCDQSEEGIVVKWKNEDHVFPFKYEIEKQEASERTWKDVHLKEIFTVNGLSDSSIFQPLKINVDDSSLYILDATDGYVKQFDLRGNFRRKVGGGLGNGPGEFEQPFDFSMDLHGNIYVVDIGARSLVSLNEVGDFRWQKLYKHNTPGHVSVSDSNVIVSVTGVNMNHIFERYDINGDLKGVYSKLVKNPGDSLDEQIEVFGKPFIGNVKIADDLTIFVPRYLSQIIFYKKDGDVENAIYTIDNATNPKLIFDRDNYHGVPGFFPIGFEGTDTNLDFSIVRNDIVIWSQQGNEKFGPHIFDIYNLTTGRYQYSAKLDLGQISGFKIVANKIFTYNTVTTEIKGYSVNSFN